MRRRENIFQICLHKGRDHTKREQLSAYLLIQNRLQYFFFLFFSHRPTASASHASRRPVLPSFSWFHTLRPNIGADMSRNKTAGIVSPQAIASTAVILASPPPPPQPPPQPPPSLHRGLGRTNSALTSAGLTALISSLIGQPLCLS